MPFFTVLLKLIIQPYLEALIYNAKSNKKNATLQVRAPLTGFIRFRKKRVWLFSSKSLQIGRASCRERVLLLV